MRRGRWVWWSRLATAAASALVMTAAAVAPIHDHSCNAFHSCADVDFD